MLFYIRYWVVYNMPIQRNLSWSEREFIFRPPHNTPEREKWDREFHALYKPLSSPTEVDGWVYLEQTEEWINPHSSIIINEWLDNRGVPYEAQYTQFTQAKKYSSGT